MDSYFNQLMEIQNSTDHSFFLLDQDSEPRFVIEADKRTIIIPAEFQFLGVKTDQRSEKIYFEVDRIFDDVDLSTKTCVIQYINAGTDDVDEGIYPVTELDTTTVPGKIVFKWEVDNIVCKYAGVVAFSVRFYEIDPETKLYTYCWNTIPESLPVLDGLNVSGSVTEDFPTELLEWNARMAALNTEITNKISAADATMKADLKTAKGYMDGAQAARGGAEEAESRVKKIVAGNEAYTKVESDTMYAKSQVKESERGTSVEISPEDGSNLAVTTYGFTQQAGTGDPSPTNVRALTNGGLNLVELVLTGAENWSVSGTTYPRFYFTLSKPAPANWTNTVACTIFKPNNILNEENKPGIGAYGTTLYLRESKYNGSVEALKADLSAKYAAGDPVIVWYQPIDESQATGLYAPIILSSGEYRATCLPLTAPLCEGDSMVSWAKSGCDKVVVFNGSENWVKSATGFYIAGPLSDFSGNSNGYCDQYPVSTVKSVSGTVYWDNAAFSVYDASYDSLESFKAALAAHPLTVWYRSTNYTETDDIAVSLETHQRAALVLYGTEAFYALPSDAGQFVLNSTGGAAAKGHATSGLCSIALNKHDKFGSGFYFVANSTQLVFGGNFAKQFESVDAFKTKLAELHTAGTPAQFVYPVSTPLVYAHPAVDIISNINENDSIVASGQKEVSVSYHKSLDKTIVELDNKSYSKQESHNIFAKALRGTSEAAKSISIHPDTGNNVVVTAHGFTKQEGSGNISPDNVRPITNGGKYCNKKVFTGSEYWYADNQKSHTFKFDPKTTINSGISTIYKGITYSQAGTVDGIYLSYTLSVIVSDLSCNTVEQFKQKLKRLYKAGTPLIIWFNKRDGEGDEKPLPGSVVYTPLVGIGENYTGTCAELTAPLCQGDTLITKVKSGCDKKIVLTGNNIYSVSENNIFFGDEFGKALTDTSSIGYGYAICERDYQFVQATYWAGIPVGKFSVGNGLIGFRPSKIKSKEEFAKEFNENPLTVWYRSSSYLEENDIPISFESHIKVVKEFGANDAFRKREDLGQNIYTSVEFSGAKSKTIVCSHYKTFSGGWGAMPNWNIQFVDNVFGIRDDQYKTIEEFKQHVATQETQGTPITVVYELVTPIVYAHDPIDFIANPDEDGAFVITGEADGTVSAEYNKDITYAFTELQSAILALGAKLSL